MRDTTPPTRSCHRTCCPTLLGPAAAGFTGLALAFVFGQPATAQSSDRPTISVAPAIAAQPAAQVPFPIQVGQGPPNSFVKVRGLPPRAALSAGHSIAPGSWAVPLNVLSGLKITLPATLAGTVDVVVTLVGLDGSVLVETKSTLVVAAPSEDRKRALQFLQKGNARLADGLIAPARLLYERAADLGLAEAAMALAATYDAVELDRVHLRNIRPDANEARRWYERARGLGAHDAEQRLRRLGKY